MAAAGLDDSTTEPDTQRRAECRKLVGDVLGQFNGRVITIDDDAAGYGWFVDLTPRINEEFRFDSIDSIYRAWGGCTSENRMDLLSALMHELGHAAGLEDDLNSDASDLMSETLMLGVRRIKYGPSIA